MPISDQNCHVVFLCSDQTFYGIRLIFVMSLQTIDLMQHLGCSVTSSSVLKKKRQISEQHKARIEDLIVSTRKNVEVNWIIKTHGLLKDERHGVVASLS
jgi:hypothetical protein